MHSAKILGAIAVLLVFVIGFSVYSLHTLADTSKQLDNFVANIENDIKAQNWEKAAQQLSSFENTWSGTSKTWAMLLDHIELDNIDTAFSKLTKYVEIKNQSLALGEAANLKQFIKHIPEKEKVRLMNIF